MEKIPRRRIRAQEHAAVHLLEPSIRPIQHKGGIGRDVRTIIFRSSEATETARNLHELRAVLDMKRTLRHQPQVRQRHSRAEIVCDDDRPVIAKHRAAEEVAGSSNRQGLRLLTPYVAEIGHLWRRVPVPRIVKLVVARIPCPIYGERTGRQSNGHCQRDHLHFRIIRQDASLSHLSVPFSKISASDIRKDIRIVRDALAVHV